jgi:hypothetical protein
VTLVPAAPLKLEGLVMEICASLIELKMKMSPTPINEGNLIRNHPIYL